MDYSRPVRRILLSPCLLLATCIATPSARAQDPGAVDRAVERGLRWLEGRQRFDGSFERAPRTGRTALAVYTLLKSGRSATDAGVQRGLAHLETADGGGTYDQACVALARSAAAPLVPLEQIQLAADTLMGMQARGGAWAYPEGEEDLSNSQYAALGLHAASRAGARVPDRVWRALGDATVDFALGDGAFGYRRDSRSGTGSMTAAGVGTLAICLAHLGQDAGSRRPARAWSRAHDAGLDWLGRRFSVQGNPGGGWHLYYLYGLERVGALADQSRIGGHDWYAEGARVLLDMQQPSGSWEGSLESTCFALLFLRRATRSVTGVGARTDRIVHKADAGGIQLRGVGVAPLRAWVAGFEPDTLDAWAWEGERSEGLRIARVVWFLDDLVAADLRGDPTESHGSERFELELAELAPGQHALRAQVQLLQQREDQAPALRVLESGVVRFQVEGGVSRHWLESARDRGRDRLPAAGLSVEASTEARARPAWNAFDDDAHTHWLARAGDPEPTLTLVPKDPVVADTVVLTQPFVWPLRTGALTRVLEAEVEVNGGRPLRVRMHADERRKARLALPQRVTIRKLEIRLLAWVPGTQDANRPGLAEVELLLDED